MPTLKQTAYRLRMTSDELLKQWGRDSFANNSGLPSVNAVKMTWRTVHILSQLCEKKWEDLTDTEQSLVLDGFYEAKAEKQQGMKKAAEKLAAMLSTTTDKSKFSVGIGKEELIVYLDGVRLLKQPEIWEGFPVRYVEFDGPPTVS